MPPRPARLETQRLVLRPLGRDDAAAFHAINVDPSVRRYLFDDHVLSPEMSADMLGRSLDLLAREGHGLFGITLRGGDALVGWAGYLYPQDPQVLEIGYALLPAYWGRGIAVEASRAVMVWGMRHLGLTAFRASTDAPNAASIRVLEKLGFAPTHRTPGPAAEQVHFALHGARLDQSGVVCVAA